MKKLLVALISSGMILCFGGENSFGVEARQPVLHRVGGGRNTWVPNINFTDWSSHEQFYVGDWLYFGFDKRVYNVLEVNKTSYEDCVEEGFITNVTRGGRDVFNLTDAKTYYFICGRGYCFQGMKVAVHVVEEPPSPPPAPAKSNSYRAAGFYLGQKMLVLVYAVTSLAVWF
ncbi:hypothetical protein MLD38_021259 [Melastoma candidum]|uniref:Uncharacterized protein n=1 Tax=Melastoma candidum TaxID=119954 RepID=A0ACB9QFL8_9MYRT|nr:hypothetical protein MLD38_021259 [Melastoma candidum]